MTEEERKKLLSEFARLQPETTLATMPYGKYKGYPFPKIPNWYLQDLATKDYLKRNLRDAVDREVWRRVNQPQKFADSGFTD